MSRNCAPLDWCGALLTRASFRYSVSWKENKNIPFNKRHRLDHSFFPKTLEIHWLSMINSAVLVMLLVGFVLLILTRMLNKDFAQFAKGDDDDGDLEDDPEEEQGWKNLHSDVFRYPEYKSLLCAIVGNGTQFLALAGFILCMALMGAFHVHHHGSMNTAAILIYAFTCGIAGCVTCSSRIVRKCIASKVGLPVADMCQPRCTCRLRV